MASDMFPSRTAIKYYLLCNPVLGIEHTQHRQNHQKNNLEVLGKLQNWHIQAEIWVCKSQHSFKRLNTQHKEKRVLQWSESSLKEHVLDDSKDSKCIDDTCLLDMISETPKLFKV